MYTNSDITLYSKTGAGYTRNIIKDVFWNESETSNWNKSGMTASSSVALFIPLTSIDKPLEFSKGLDLIVKGFNSFEFVNTSEETVSNSLKTLKLNTKVFNIEEADFKDFGSKNMQHYKLLLK